MTAAPAFSTAFDPRGRAAIITGADGGVGRLFPASGAAAMINGADLPIDGGNTIR